MQPNQSAQIRPQVTGKILKRLFEEGGIVSENELLYVIDPTPFEADVQEAEADQKRAGAELSYAREVLARNEQLAAKEYISQIEFEKLQQNIDVANANLASASAKLALAQINLGYCYIKAPFAGRISYNGADPGSIVRADSTVLTELLQTSPLKIEFNITDAEFDLVQKAWKQAPLHCQVFSRHVGNGQKNKGSGPLTAADNTIDRATGTIRLQAIIDNKAALFWPGQYVDVSLVLRVVKNALVIPTKAIMIQQGKPYVFAVRGHSAHKVNIEIEDNNGKRAIVKKGLQPTDLVITDGQFNVSNGKPVRVIHEKKKSDHHEPSL